MYRVTDPQHVYPIQSVEIAHDDVGKAVLLALEAMMGCPAKDMIKATTEALERLEVYDLSGGHLSLVEHAQASALEAYWSE